jgi:hypothetical protein
MLTRPASAAASPALLPDHGGILPTAPSMPSSTSQDGPPPAETTSPPAKLTRKAARRRCEVELQHESDTDEEVQLSPVFQVRQVPPIDSDPAQAIRPTPDPPPSPPMPSVPEPSLLPAESPVGLPPPPSSPSPVQPDTPAESPAPNSPEPVAGGICFFKRPDWIICCKCRPILTKMRMLSGILILTNSLPSDMAQFTGFLLFILSKTRFPVSKDTSQDKEKGKARF